MDLKTFHSLLMPPSLEVIRFLKSEGVRVDALCEPELPAFPRVEFHDELPFFHLSDDDGAGPALVFLARDDLNGPDDFVAWSPRQKRLASWYDTPILGAEQLYAPRIELDGALKIYESPMGWLRNGRDGVVVINQRRAAWILFRVGPFVAETAEHARLVAAIVDMPPPVVLVRDRPQ